MAATLVLLHEARQEQCPATWKVFTMGRGRVRGFLSGTSGDPDPLLVITSDGVVEWRDGKTSHWRSASFSVWHQTETVQAFIEAYAIHQARRSTGP